MYGPFLLRLSYARILVHARDWLRVVSLTYPVLVLMAPSLAVWALVPEWAGPSGLALTIVSALSLLLVAHCFRDAKHLFLALTPLALPAVLYAGYVVLFRRVPGEGVWLSIATINIKEFDSLIRMFAGHLWFALGALALYLLCAVGRPALLPFNSRRKALLAAGCVVSMGVLPAPEANPDAVTRIASKSFPFGVLHDLASTLWQESRAAAQPVALPIIQRESIEGKEIYILVVGETIRRDVWLAELPSAPSLRSANVVDLSDVVAQGVLTQLSAPMLITGVTGPKARHSPNFLHFAKAGGCTPIWLTMNDIGPLYRGVAVEYYDNWRTPLAQRLRYDTDLLPLLQDKIAKYEKVCVLLHTEGAHGAYVDRYPESFRSHPVHSRGIVGDATPRSERELERIAYRNAVAYTQMFLTQLISIVAAQDARSFIIFAPDHGENLWDDERELVMHGFGTRFEFEVPALVWASDAFIRSEPDKWRYLQRNKDKPTTNASVLPTLLDAMRVTPLLGKSLLREWVAEDRMVNLESIDIPYRLIK